MFRENLETKNSSDTQQVLREHFGHLSSQDINKPRGDGTPCLRDRLVSLKREKRLSQGRLSASMRQRLKAEYGTMAGPATQLQVKDRSLPVSPGLEQGLKDAHSSNPARRSFAGLEAWMLGGQPLNQRELVGLLKGIGSLSPAQPRSRRHILKVIEYLMAIGAMTEHGEELSKVTAIFDGCLAATFTAQKGHFKNWEAWVTAFQNHVTILPGGANIIALANTPESQRTSTNILGVVEGSLLGKKLLEKQSAAMQLMEWSKKLDADLVTLLKGPLTLEKIQAWKVPLRRGLGIGIFERGCLDDGQLDCPSLKKMLL